MHMCLCGYDCVRAVSRACEYSAHRGRVEVALDGDRKVGQFDDEGGLGCGCGVPTHDLWS